MNAEFVRDMRPLRELIQFATTADSGCPLPAPQLDELDELAARLRTAVGEMQSVLHEQTGPARVGLWLAGIGCSAPAGDRPEDSGAGTDGHNLIDRAYGAGQLLGALFDRIRNLLEGIGGAGTSEPPADGGNPEPGSLVWVRRQLSHLLGIGDERMATSGFSSGWQPPLTAWAPSNATQPGHWPPPAAMQPSHWPPPVATSSSSPSSGGTTPASS